VRASAIALAAALLVGAGCHYAPDIAGGTLMCAADSSCPDGYGCVGDFCYRDDEVKFIGSWIFGSPTPQIVNCGGVMMNQDLAGDYLDVGADVTGTADLSAFYYCDWGVKVSGDRLVLVPGGSCSAPDTVTPDLSFTWHAQRFTITATSATTATLDASIPYEYNLAGATGSCTMTITSTMSKGTPSP
jgi:hypothetical protein